MRLLHTRGSVDKSTLMWFYEDILVDCWLRHMFGVIFDVLYTSHTNIIYSSLHLFISEYISVNMSLFFLSISLSPSLYQYDPSFQLSIHASTHIYVYPFPYLPTHIPIHLSTNHVNYRSPITRVAAASGIPQGAEGRTAIKQWGRPDNQPRKKFHSHWINTERKPRITPKEAEVFPLASPRPPRLPSSPRSGQVTPSLQGERDFVYSACVGRKFLVAV